MFGKTRLSVGTYLNFSTNHVCMTADSQFID